MRSIKKRLAALIRPGGRDWDLYAQTVAFGYNTTLHKATGYSPFFMVQGREATLLLHRELDELRVDATSKQWLTYFWEARIHVYESFVAEKKRCKGLIY